MKKITAILCIIISLLLCTSCAKKSSTPPEGGGGSAIDYQSTIASLEAQLIELQKNQTLADSERQQKIEELTAVIESLKAEAEKKDDTDSSVNVTPAFKYIVTGTTATLTGYTGNDTDIVIPASVDGYRVTAIADGAFEGSPAKSVIISDGVTSIGWFAFNGCTALRSVTIPSSVTSIGYLAFGEGQDSLTVYCHSGSFALAYAQSYGISYTVI